MRGQRSFSDQWFSRYEFWSNFGVLISSEHISPIFWYFRWYEAYHVLEHYYWIILYGYFEGWTKFFWPVVLEIWILVEFWGFGPILMVFEGVPTIFSRCILFYFKENTVMGWNQSSNLLPGKVVTDMRYFLLLRRCVEWLIRSDRGGATKTKQKRNMFNTVSDVVLSDLRNCYI